MSPEQTKLAILGAKRDAARSQLDKYRTVVHELAQAEQAAQQAEADAFAALQGATAAKIKTGLDATPAARAAYQAAMSDLAVTQTEHEAGKRVLVEAEQELEHATKAAHRQGAVVAKLIADAAEPALLQAAAQYAKALAQHRALTRAARVASAESGLISDPIPDLANSNNPLRLQLDELIAGKGLEISFNEADLMEAKL